MVFVDEMDIVVVVRIIIFGFYFFFMVVQELFVEVVVNIGVVVDQVYWEIVDKQGDQCKDFFILVMLGGVVIIVGLVYLGWMVVCCICIFYSYVYKLV